MTRGLRRLRTWYALGGALYACGLVFSCAVAQGIGAFVLIAGTFVHAVHVWMLQDW